MSCRVTLWGPNGEGSDVVEMPSTTRDEIAVLAATLGSVTAGVDWAYDLLDALCQRHGLDDAYLVLRPEPSNLQVFRRGRRSVPGDALAALTRSPSGVFDAASIPVTAPPHDAAKGAAGTAGSPGATPGLDEMASTMLGALCDARFRALVAQTTAAVDPTTGLSSRHALDQALTRAAACGARYGWASTIVLLSTGGETPSDQRWQALAGSILTVLRTGDVAGVLAPGTALVILGNVGVDMVRPFVARVRAALSAAGFDGDDLFVATSSTPRESVDPTELRRLALERLEAMGARVTSCDGDRSTVELALRMQPEVAWVAWAEADARPHVTVGAWHATDDLTVRVTRSVHEHFADASVNVVDAGAEALDVIATHAASPLAVAAVGTPVGVPVGVPVGAGSRGHTNGSSYGTATSLDLGAPRDLESANGAPPLISATAPGVRDHASAPGTPRVSMLHAAFDAARGVTEVSLGLGTARATGRAPAGPLVGGAQATLSALHALGKDVPFYLVSAERALGVPGEPVVVVLGARQGSGDRSVGADERIGVAGGSNDAEAAGRATLGALNRYLSRPCSL